MKFIHLIRCNIPLVASKQLWRTMRIFMVIMTVFLMQVSASTKAQQLTIRDSNISLKEVFQQIRKQTGYTVLAPSEVLAKVKSLNLNINQVALEKALISILSGQGLEFTIKNKAIFISEKEKSVIDRLVDYFAQIDVSGKLVDENGQPIAGATIRVKGSSLATNSENDGSFLLKNVAENAVLEISYIGFLTKELKALTQLGTIVLQVSIGKLEEVSVNAGYYQVKERELTGSIARITAKDIENQPVTNVLATMQGRMAGVAITQTTGTPGGGFNIQIRGQNSIRRTANAPLYIIDGVPYASDPIGYTQTSTVYPATTSPLNSINPDNIESIEVLKDADATSIYGSRGANGVVLITTKKGKVGKTKFSFTGSTGIGQATKFMELMDTKQYLLMRQQAYANDGIKIYPADAYDVNGTWDQNRYTDWQKELMGGTAKMQDLQGTISGGSDRTQFLLSGSYHDESVVYPGDFRYKKGGIHMNVSHRSQDNRFHLNFSSVFNGQDNDQPAADLTFVAQTLAPNAPALYNSDGSLNWENQTWQNPLAQLNAEFKTQTKDLVANALLSYNITSDLVVKSSFGYTDLSTFETRTAPSTRFDPIYNVSSVRSTIYRNNTARSSWIVEPQLTWEKQIGGGKLTALIGSTFQSQNNQTLYQSGNGFSSNNLIYNLAAAQNITVLGNDETMYNYQAFFGRLNYNYKQRYILNLTARRDGSSRFGPKEKFANFAAAGVAWLFSNEDFLKDNPLISFGKLRGSFGTTGSDQIGDYQFLNTFTTTGVIYNGAVALQPSRLFNPNFRWEMNKKLELAIELGFLNDRIFTTASWYQNRSANQLVGIPLPGTTGFTSIQANLDATVENKGLEFTVQTINFNKGDFRWSTNFNLSFSRNKLISFPGLMGSTYSQQLRIGQPLNIALVYQYKNVNPTTGLYEFEDLNKDGKISSPLDKQIVADLNPKYFGGLQNELSYKGFSLDFLFQFVKQKNRLVPFGPAGTFSNQPARMVNSWNQNGSNANYQINTTGVNSAAAIADSNYSLSDALIADASFIRLKHLSLSYDIPLKLKETSCRVMLRGQNLLTLTKFKDGDPEFATYGYLPPLRVISAGLQFTF